MVKNVDFFLNYDFTRDKKGYERENIFRVSGVDPSSVDFSENKNQVYDKDTPKLHKAWGRFFEKVNWPYVYKPKKYSYEKWSATFLVYMYNAASGKGWTVLIDCKNISNLYDLRRYSIELDLFLYNYNRTSPIIIMTPEITESETDFMEKKGVLLPSLGLCGFPYRMKNENRSRYFKPMFVGNPEEYKALINESFKEVNYEQPKFIRRKIS